MKNIIVSGATGQTGSYMCEHLLEDEDNFVIATTRRTSQAILGNLKKCIGNPRFKMIDMDLCDPHSIREVIKNERPDYFLNFGASAFVPDSWKSPALCMQVNTISLIHILEAIKDYAPKCKVYSSGSSEQWGNVEYSPQDENHPHKPRSIYGVSKSASEMVSKVYRESYDISVYHAICYNHESPRRQKHYVTRKITNEVARIKSEFDSGRGAIKKINSLKIGNILAKRDWSHAKDFAKGIWNLVNNGDANKRYVFSNNSVHSVKEFIEICFEKIGISLQWWLPTENRYLNNQELENLSEKDLVNIQAVDEAMNILVEIDPQFFRPAEVSLLHGDSSLARKELGWLPEYSFEDLVNEMMENDLKSYE